MEVKSVRGGRRGTWWMVAVLVLLGVFLGDVLAPALSRSLPILARSASLGFPPTELSLFGVLRITVGLHLAVTVLGAIGGLVGLLAGRRL